ncbi:YggS family pyridoxal phosphate-dependent enzyme [Bosea sp. 685]|uniref:YggS family pyridoxal phosphate-dependent enzyme n=1 Tax=Bosea sp. 685 TaxID=3080057 RepID=UPI002892F529|nr:YggS family pyridoxal phosphate-dependent enzyme [Bosea sp. 685]WNJ87880.1 YggS family pyridoxal phosphate-dependent enzyme [Bosea sp. 685]
MTGNAVDPPLSEDEIKRFGEDPRATFRANLAAVEERMDRACRRSGRSRGSIALLPVTKTVPAHILRRAYDAGISQFAENKVQEAISKRAELSDLSIEWSIVGHLQTNKVKFVAGFARAFHALDSLRVADLLNERLEREDRRLDVFVQVNTSGEESKYGLHPDAVDAFVGMLDRFPRLTPRGLMTLAVFSPDMEKVRPCFRMLRRLRDQIALLNPTMSELSMGMSGDFEAAIEEGANVVRVGQAIFGVRPTPDGHYWPGLASNG